jgi:hypothetical protein
VNTSDVQVYDYVTDNGRRISVALGTFGEIEKDRTVDVTITVDGVERLHMSDHTKCPAGVPLGEWLIHPICMCICVHMEYYSLFQMMQNLLSMANADELQLIPLDDRHISQLTDEQAEWWNEDSNHPLIDYLIDQARPAAEQALRDYPILGTTKEND